MRARIQLQLAAKYLVPRLGGKYFYALTVNMSRSGILLQRHEAAASADRSEQSNGPAIEIGDLIQVEVNLPAIESMQPRCLCIIGQVTRADNGLDGQHYIAVRVRTMQFRDAQVTDVRHMAQSSAFVM
jgi:hypothetical protein